MLAVLIVIAVVAIVIAGVAVAFGGHRRFNEVDRFHRASEMTTEWARAGVTEPVIVDLDSGETAPGQRRQRSGA